MSDEEKKGETPIGPVEAFRGPKTLEARAVAVEGEVSLLGYSLVNDLARYYRPSDVFFLSLTGNLPSDLMSEKFAKAVVFASSISVREAPSHLGLLAKCCDSYPSARVGVVALSLTELARDILMRHGVWFLSKGAPPSVALASDELDAQAGASCLQAIGLDRAERLSLESAVLLALASFGIVTEEKIVAFFVWAKLPVALAETFLADERGIQSYPLGLPSFAYSETK